MEVGMSIIEPILTVDGGTLLPGFTLPVRIIFETIE
jgi:hypothetical protein